MEERPIVAQVTVYGTAQPAGSKTAGMGKGGKMYVRDANPSAKEWKAAVTKAAAEQYDGEILTGPLAVEIDFYRLRNKGHYGSGRNAGIVLPSAPARPTVAPDATKLGRGTEDAMIGIVYQDDSQVVDLHLRKHYGEPARAEIVIRSIVVDTVGSERQASLLAP